MNKELVNRIMIAALGSLVGGLALYFATKAIEKRQQKFSQ